MRCRTLSYWLLDLLIVDDVERHWFEKGLATARRIIDGFESPQARFVLTMCPQYISDVAGDFDIDTFVTSLSRRLKTDGVFFPSVYDLQKVAVSIFVAAAKIEREREQLVGIASPASTRRDEITYACEMLRELGLDLAGVPFYLHTCEQDPSFNENGECLFCKTNDVRCFEDRLVRDFVTTEFANLDSGESDRVADALQRLRHRFNRDL